MQMFKTEKCLDLDLTFYTVLYRNGHILHAVNDGEQRTGQMVVSFKSCTKTFTGKYSVLPSESS